jgi:hypothetical protein
MTQPDIEVSAEAIRKHALAVDEAATMFQEAAAGAAYVDMHDEVYGVLCSPIFLPFLNPLQDNALTEMKSGADATRHLAELLRAVAADYDLTDSEAARRFQKGI